ncbi:Methyltransferase domain-containing protein [Halobacillus dabanensis]|uniref:Methyltransferase domain-containing protein n=1 Tax=Halobacillus dabanensis TaxID=240302 RepID=A0A1I3UY95_HALDA|nr:class I SAM-dependent methyltransferase [Halobacillus dabanensis]SFJ87870.1 Methyltransferase domain-containing protein [Halobacillus dabanensis]
MKNHENVNSIDKFRKKVAYLDSSQRREQFSPESLLDSLQIQRHDHLLDVGAGTGFLTIPAAKRTDGTVYALDIDANMIGLLESKAKEEGIENIQTIQAGMKDSSLPNDSVDVVMASLVLHEINPLAETLQDIKQVLKQNGFFVCVELEDDPNNNHPRISSTRMEQELTKAGFHIHQKFYPTESIYVFIVQKPADSMEQYFFGLITDIKSL